MNPFKFFPPRCTYDVVLTMINILEMIDTEVEKKILTMQNEKEILGMRNLASFLKKTYIDDKFRKDMQTIFQNIRKDVGIVEKLMI